MTDTFNEKAKSEHLDQVFFNLEDTKFQQFAAMLDAPVKPNPGLERLLAVEALWTKN